jgi:fatty-acid peroxygenase
MGPQCLDDFRDIVRARSKEALARWRGREVIVLDEARRIFFKAIMDWASIPYTAGDVESRSNDLMAMIEGFGSLGLRHLHGRLARHRSEQWIANLLAETRGGRIHPRAGSALAEIARHPLPLNVATVELLNVIRPIMAAAYFVDVAAAALQLHRHLRGPVGEDAAAADRFVQEVRRFTAFTPFLGAEACRDVDFNGQVIPRGSLVVLDVHGIHRDARIWPGAAAFDPDRFLERPYDRFNILQQGGGDHAEGHRCAGEWLTIEALKMLSKRLAAVNGVASVSNLLFDLRRVPSRLREPIRLRVA